MRTANQSPQRRSEWAAVDLVFYFMMSSILFAVPTGVGIYSILTLKIFIIWIKYFKYLAIYGLRGTSNR